MTTYTTRTDAIQAEIIDAIEAGEATAAEFNIEAIADAVLGDYGQGYGCIVSEDELWTIVAENAR